MKLNPQGDQDMMWNPQECVERGMEWLDTNYPDWLGRVRPADLDLGGRFYDQQDTTE